MIDDNQELDMLVALREAAAKPEKVKIWADALRQDDLVQVKKRVFEPSCGGMCVLGVAFYTFFPERWTEYIKHIADGTLDASADPFVWDYDLGIALDTSMLVGDEQCIDPCAFWEANDAGATLTEIADVLDKYVAETA